MIEEWNKWNEDVSNAIKNLNINQDIIRKKIDNFDCCKNCDAIDRMKVLDLRYEFLKKRIDKLEKSKTNKSLKKGDA